MTSLNPLWLIRMSYARKQQVEKEAEQREINTA